MKKYKVVEVKINWLMGNCKTDAFELEINNLAEQGWTFLSSQALNFSGLSSKLILFFGRDD